MMKRTLFGGALIGAGIVSATQTAHAQVTDVGIEADLRVGDLFQYIPDPYEPDGPNYSYEFVENQSYAVSGGLELSPFGRSALGGNQGGRFDISQGVSAELNAAVQPDGGFTLTGRTAASWSNFFGGDPPSIGADLTVTFTLLQPAEFDLTFNRSFDSSSGAAGGSLSRDGSILFQSAPGILPSEDVFSGLLAPGVYTLESEAFNSGFASFDLTVGEPIPTPASVAMLGIGGVLAARRRRT